MPRSSATTRVCHGRVLPSCVGRRGWSGAYGASHPRFRAAVVGAGRSLRPGVSWGDGMPSLAGLWAGLRWRPHDRAVFTGALDALTVVQPRGPQALPSVSEAVPLRVGLWGISSSQGASEHPLVSVWGHHPSQAFRLLGSILKP